MKNRNKKNSARDLINLESTYTEKENITKENDNPQSGKKVCKEIYQQVIHLQNKQTAHAAQNTHTHTHTPEMGQRSKWIFFQRTYPDRYSSVQFSSVAQSCPTRCDPIDGSTPGSAVPGILQAILEWVAISFSNALKWKVKVKLLSRLQLLATPWTVAHQAPLSMGFSRP